VRFLSCIIILMAYFVTSALAQTRDGDQFKYQLAQQKSQQYSPPRPSPAERARCKLHRPALNAASRRVCKMIKARPGSSAS
jgi:hypothetical protein